VPCSTIALRHATIDRRTRVIRNALEPLEARLLLANTRLAVIGDYSAEVASQPIQDVANLVASWSPDAVVTVGDNNYPAGEAATIDQNIGKYYHQFIYPYVGSFGAGPADSQNHFWPALGNHDLDTNAGQAYYNYFTLPNNERYYTKQIGNVALFVIDADPREADGRTASSIQAQYIHNQMLASTAKWKLVVFHHPAYSSGNHGDDPEMQWPFKDWGATAVLQGHDHDYERQEVGGLPYFVDGLAGESIDSWTGVDAGSLVRYNGDYGAMQVDATDTSISFKFITRTGALIDTYTISQSNTNSTAKYIPEAATWKYLDTGAAPGATWKSDPNFVDTAWQSGPAQLGYGDGDEATTVSFGSNNNKFITTYFRNTFSVVDRTKVAVLTLSLLRDDGAVVYLNGTEVYRSNMPAGTIANGTLASTDLGGANEQAWFAIGIDPTLLLNGSNVIAVEVHQFSATSSDISFDFQLTGTVLQAAPTSSPAAPSTLASAMSGASSINLTWADNANNESGFKLERSTNGVQYTQIALPTADSTSYLDTVGITPNTRYYYRIRATNVIGDSGYSNVTTILTPSIQTIIPAGSTWKYLDTGTAPGATWKSDPNFVETGWKSGAAQLGYGDGDEATVVGFGPNTNSKYITTWFRKVFNVASPASISTLTLNLMRDDGAVVYLNGTEVYRTNMPAGTPTATTTAVDAIGGADESAWYTATINPNLLVAGSNVIAVEMHQQAGSSSDISFDFSLMSTATTQSGPPPAPALSAPSALSAKVISSTQINLTWVDSTTGEDGFSLERSTDGTTFAQFVTVPAGSTSYNNTQLTAGTTYWYRIRAYKGASSFSFYSGPTSATTLAGSTALPTGFTDADVGATIAGSATYSGGVFTIKGAGAQIWSTADGFNFVYQRLTGDGTIIGRVLSVQNTNANAAAGLMIREGLTAGSKHASMLLTASNELAFVRRTATGSTSSVTSGTGAAGYWLKLVRSGTTVTGFASVDGITYTQIGTTTITMTDPVYIGLVVSSANTAALCTGTMSNVSITTTGGTQTFSQTTIANVTTEPTGKPKKHRAADLLV
jgi:hypothetical protein